VLGTSNHASVLDPLDSLSDGNSSQDWIRAEA
jgi:hypothetical protein